MKIIVGGGGSVGTAIALDLLDRHHDVTLMEQNVHTAERIRSMLPGVHVMAADACEYASLAAADLRDADVIIAATGDDEDNLVISWLAKQEFGVPRVIARINNSRNEWLFNTSWGVDVAVSTPALITSLVDEAVEVGSIINLMDLADGKMRLIEITLAADAPAVANNQTLDDLRLADSVRIVAVVRNEQPMIPSSTMHFLENDHVILITRGDATQECANAFIA
ncbi:MAG: TrkA family potassium uptake protein [Acidimicrobiales bacterium]